MGSYIPVTPAEKARMMAVCGLSSARDMYRDVPDSVYLDHPLSLPEGQSELSVLRTMRALAGKNPVYGTCLRGAGAYRHYIPAIVRAVTGKEEFLTAYTPYQAEISQGILQSIFEYQTMICELTGMDVSNASVYDGATAAAEAIHMTGERGRNKALVAATIHPDVRNTIQTYTRFSGMPVTIAPEKEGRIDPDALANLLTPDVACLYVQQPNFYGCLEDVERLFALAHEKGVKCILGVNPIALGILKSPRAYQADIAVGEGQPLGLPLNYGGPYLGFMACTQALMRRLPGRIVGQTTDSAGKRAFVLTLQAREQHIRREKASSNICSNEAHCALTAGAYLAAMGPEGLQNVATQCLSKAAYFAKGLEKLGLRRVHAGPVFHEFVTVCPVPPAKLEAALAKEGILCGLPIREGILWCVTELVTKEEMDKALEVIGRCVCN